MKHIDLTPDQNRALENEIGDLLGFDVEVDSVQEAGDGKYVAWYSYDDPKDNYKSKHKSMEFSGRFGKHSVEDFKRGHAVTEKVHTLKNPGVEKRGAPTGPDRARAFDKVNPKTGARPDRSVLRTGSGKYHAVEGSNEGDYMQVHVVRDDIDSGNYHGINVLFMADGKVEKSTADKWADEQWYEDKDKIIAVARKFFGADKIAAFVKRGGDAHLRADDDFDNGHNGYSANPDTHKKSDYHGYHDPKTNEDKMLTFKQFLLTEGKKPKGGPFGVKLGGVREEETSFGFEDRLNAQKTESELKDAGIKYERDSAGGIFYFHFDSMADMKKAIKLANRVIDKSEESEW